MTALLDIELVIEALYDLGRKKAYLLREAAPNLSDTEVIDNELFVPEWKEGQQVLGAVTGYNGQVYRVLQAHDSTGIPTWNPVGAPSLFSVCHTKNPAKAKPWVTPYGTSGMYTLGDCYIDGQGTVQRQIYDGDNIYDAVAMPERWEAV